MYVLAFKNSSTNRFSYYFIRFHDPFDKGDLTNRGIFALPLSDLMQAKNFETREEAEIILNKITKNYRQGWEILKCA